MSNVAKKSEPVLDLLKHQHVGEGYSMPMSRETIKSLAALVGVVTVCAATKETTPRTEALTKALNALPGSY